MTPIKAIRAHCLSCKEGVKAVRLCKESHCVFHQYRMGKNPARKGVGGNPRLISKAEEGFVGKVRRWFRSP